MCLCRAVAYNGFTAPARRALRVRDSSGSHAAIGGGAATHSPTPRPLSALARGAGARHSYELRITIVFCVRVVRYV